MASKNLKYVRLTAALAIRRKSWCVSHRYENSNGVLKLKFLFSIQWPIKLLNLLAVLL